MVGRWRSTLPAMVELDGGKILLLPADARRLDRALGTQRRPLGHRADRRLNRADRDGALSSDTKFLQHREPPPGGSSLFAGAARAPGQKRGELHGGGRALRESHWCGLKASFARQTLAGNAAFVLQ